jgi:hypothetical protein
LNVPSRLPFVIGLATAVDILRFRKGPEDMPASTALLWAAVLGGVVVRLVGQASTMGQSVATPAVGNPLVLMAIELGVPLLCLGFGLRMAGHPARFVQTATALLMCQLVMAPALLASRWLLVNYFDQPGTGSMARLLFFGISVWLLAVTVRILRSATGWPVFGCVLFALGIEVLALAIMIGIYPDVLQAAAGQAPA